MIKAGEIVQTPPPSGCKAATARAAQAFWLLAKILAQGQFICPEHEKRMKGSRPAEPGGKVEKINIVAAKRLEVKA